MGIFSDINKVQLLGNLTADPEIRYTQNGIPVASFNIATSRKYKQNDEWKEDVVFIPVVLWDRLAKHAQDRLSKGSRVLIEGRMVPRSWEDQSGQKRYKTEVVASDMILIARYKTKDEVQHQDAPPPAANPADDYVDPDDLPF